MTQTNGTQGSQVAVSIPENPPVLDFTPPGEITALRTAETPTRTKQRAREQIRHNRFVIIAAGAVVMALLLFAMISAPTSLCHTNQKALALRVRTQYSRKKTCRLKENSFRSPTPAGPPRKRRMTDI